VDDAVAMAVVERAGNLTGKLAGLLLLEAAMGDDVVEHLAPIDKLAQHVPMVVGADDVTHATDVGVVEQADNGSLAGGAHLLGVVGALPVGGALVLVLGQPRHDLDGRVLARVLMLGQLHLAHAARANGLAEGPGASARRGDGGAPLGRGGRVRAGVGVGGQGGHGRRVRCIPRVAAAAGVTGRLGGDAGLLVVTAGDVVEAG